MRVAKTKALISFAVTAKLICAFVFANAKSRFLHDAAHLCIGGKLTYQSLSSKCCKLINFSKSIFQY